MIRCRNLCLDYTLDGGAHVSALSDISLDIGDSEFVAVIGPNGSGKSSLALCLSGLLIAGSGTIEIDGRDIRDLIRTREIRDILGIVFQNPDDQIITNFVEREIAFSLENRAVPRERMKHSVTAMLHQLGIEALKNRSPNQLSGGQKQKLVLGSVLVADPKYLILDEPTSFLDTPYRKTMLRRLRMEYEARKKEGFTVILITQFSREAAQCDRIILMNRGKIAADSAPDLLFTHEQEFLEKIGVEIPVDYRVKKALPELQLPETLFDYRKEVNP